MWTNHADTATLSTTTSGSMLRPLTQLQVPWLGGLCRGPANGGGHTVPAELTIRADLGSAKLIHLIGLVGLNAPNPPIAYNESQASMVVSLSNVSPGGSELGGGSAAWVISDGDEFGQSLWVLLETPVSARYVEVYVNVFGRASGERYVDARRLLIMAGSTQADGFNTEWDANSVDMSVSEVTPRGGVFVSEQGGYRTMRASLSGMTLAEAKTNRLDNHDTDSLSRFISSAGRKTEVVISPRYTTDPSESFQNTIYGRLVDWSPIKHTGGDTYACDSIVIHETPYPALS